MGYLHSHRCRFRLFRASTATALSGSCRPSTRWYPLLPASLVLRAPCLAVSTLTSSTIRATVLSLLLSYVKRAEDCSLDSPVARNEFERIVGPLHNAPGNTGPFVLADEHELSFRL
ncbi:hypothetical protein KM043_016977 [Ampulex compressa]|nr:hypothetical protein KM043_016977 [Ampulex compressa]